MTTKKIPKSVLAHLILLATYIGTLIGASIQIIIGNYYGQILAVCILVCVVAIEILAMYIIDIKYAKTLKEWNMFLTFEREKKKQ